MPRKADARLEGRILDAAHRILSERGEKALTMRAVASACSPATPAPAARTSDSKRRRRKPLSQAVMSPSSSVTVS